MSNTRTSLSPALLVTLRLLVRPSVLMSITKFALIDQTRFGVHAFEPPMTSLKPDSASLAVGALIRAGLSSWYSRTKTFTIRRRCGLCPALQNGHTLFSWFLPVTLSKSRQLKLRAEYLLVAPSLLFGMYTQCTASQIMGLCSSERMRTSTVSPAKCERSSGSTWSESFT